MKTVELIPIKLENKRLPYKNMKTFYDVTPLIHFIQKVCLGAKMIDAVYIYCFNERLREYTIDGVKFLKSSTYLNEDSINANDIIHEFMKKVDADVYINVHTTSLFAKPKTIDLLLSNVLFENYDRAICAENFKTFIWSEGKPLNFNPDRFPRTQDLPNIYSETSIANIFTKECFQINNRRLGRNPYIRSCKD